MPVVVIAAVVGLLLIPLLLLIYLLLLVLLFLQLLLLLPLLQVLVLLLLPFILLSLRLTSLCLLGGLVFADLIVHQLDVAASAALWHTFTICAATVRWLDVSAAATAVRNTYQVASASPRRLCRAPAAIPDLTHLFPPTLLLPKELQEIATSALTDAVYDECRKPIILQFLAGRLDAGLNIKGYCCEIYGIFDLEPFSTQL